MDPKSVKTLFNEYETDKGPRPTDPELKAMAIRYHVSIEWLDHEQVTTDIELGIPSLTGRSHAPDWLGPWMSAIECASAVVLFLDRPPARAHLPSTVEMMKVFLFDPLHQKSLAEEPEKWAYLPYLFEARCAIDRLRRRDAAGVPRGTKLIVERLIGPLDWDQHGKKC